MQQRKRLIKANRKPLDSFDQDFPVHSATSNVLNNIHNQNLYLKLVGIALQMSREAKVSESSLAQLQKKLLGAKGFQEYSMLNQDNQKQINKFDLQRNRNSYNVSKKYLSPREQIAFLNQMEKQIQEVQTKEHIIYALKKYIEEKKKALIDPSTKTEPLTRQNFFNKKIKQRQSKKSIHRANFYGQTIRQIIGRIEPENSRAYETLRKMVHLKSLWGHTFFSEVDQQYCPVYNVIFDGTQKLILTGGQDGKIKIWSRDTGALLSTLQGHKYYINKICVSKDNSMVLSAAQDGVRFFDLVNMNSLGGYNFECIMDIGEVTHKDQKQTSIIFATSTHKLFVIPSKKIKSERHRKLQCYDFKVYNFASRMSQNSSNTNTMTITSQGIVFLGFLQGEILIFDFHRLQQAEIDEENYGTAQGMDRVQQFVLPILRVFTAHEGDIIQITWNPILSCFSTGAKKDGICKIWEFKIKQPQRQPILIKELKIPKVKQRRKKIYNCNFCCWNITFTHIACSFQQQQIQEESDNRGEGEVVIYNAMRKEITWQVSKTITNLSSIRAMDCHPFYENIMVVCDSFGKIMLIDIYQNYLINIFQERAFHLGHPQFCLVPSQCRFSQDGLTLLVSTQYGNFSIYGYNIKQFYSLAPTQQLFSNDYEQFQISPLTYKPVLDIESNVDINDLNRGFLQNMKHQEHKNYLKVDTAKYFKQIFGNSQQSKQQHRNQFQINIEQVQRMASCYMDHQSNCQFLRNNIEEIQNKRMALIYEQRQIRQADLKKVIQQKSQRMKQVDQGIVSQLITSSNQNSQIFSVTNPSNMVQESHIQSQPRRRGRRVTRLQAAQSNPYNTRRTEVANYYMDEVGSQNGQNAEINEDENYNEIREENYSLASEMDDYGGEDDDEEDQINQDSQSDQILVASRRRNLRLSNRNRANNHRSNANNSIRIRRNLRRRPASQEIEQLQNQYEQQISRPRKRQRAQSPEPEPDLNNVEQRREIRRVASRSIGQNRYQSQKNRQKIDCFLCKRKEATVACHECKDKHYCEDCKNFRGKKFSQATWHANNFPNYVCFQCYYAKNIAPTAHRNISFQKYIVGERNDLFTPQIGDQVVYFFQGYEQFLFDKIQILNPKYLAQYSNLAIVPHEQHPSLLHPEKCTVIDVSYCFPLVEDLQMGISYRGGSSRGRRAKPVNVQDILMLVTLRGYGIQFLVFYLPGYEFLLKWQIYDDIVQNDRYGKFKLYDIVKIKDQQIQIMQVRPLNDRYEGSIWKNIIVHKAQAKNLRRSKDKNEDIAINIWNIDGFISPEAFDYNICMPASQREHYKKQILRIKQSQPKLWEIFGHFVDTELYPLYIQYVQVSMCLSLILQRLENNYYASEASFIKDVKMINQNSIQFNSRESEITQMSQQLVRQILQGQNYNNSNQVDFATEKKTRFKKKFNSGSSPKQAEQSIQKQKQGQKDRRNRQLNNVKVSKFEEQVIDIGNDRVRPRKRNKKMQESEDDYKQEALQDDDYESESAKPNTRSKRRVENNSHLHNSQYNHNNVKREQAQNCRVTRSRTKN